MFFSFSKPYYLFLLLPVVIYIWWFYIKNKSLSYLTKGIYIIRTLTAIFLILSLAGPSIVKTIDGQWVVYLADLSYSTVHGENFKEWIEESSKFMGKKDKMAVLAFGSDTQLLRSFSRQTPINWNVGVNKEFTDIERALKVAAGLLPGDVNGRIVLISDGYENIGDSLAFAKMLGGNNIPVDVYPLHLKIGNEVAIKGVNLPANTYQGQRVLLEVEIESTSNTEGELTIFWENRVIYKETVKIPKGSQTLVFPVEITGSGFQRVKAVIQSKDDKILENNRSEGLTLVDAPPKVLIVEGRKDIGFPLYHLFKENGVDVTLIQGGDFPKNLEGLLDYKGIFFVDVPRYILAETSLNNLKTFVEVIGGGFVAIGGKNSFGMGYYGDSPLEEILPVTMEVESQQELPGIELVLVIDRSGSMDGEKLNMAKNAGISALDILGEKDKLGLITFDHSFYVDFPLTEVTEKDRLKRIIQNITIGGGTSIYPALEKAVTLFTKETGNKHIILLSDGVEGPQNYEELLARIRREGITLTTIALGNDADLQLMEYLAVNGGGRFYDVRNVVDLPGVFSRETLLVAGNYIIEEEFTPKSVSPAYNPFKGGAPLLRGYIATTLKPGAEEILTTHRDHPLYARFHYGLGKTVAFTSDSYGMWTKNFLSSPDFPTLWLDTLNWVVAGENYGDLGVNVQLKGSGVEIIVRVMNPLEEGETLTMTLVKEGGEKEQVELIPLSSREYRGIIENLFQGTYFLNTLRKKGETTTGLNINGFTLPYSAEYSIDNLQDTGYVLRKIAEVTGGRVLKRPYEVFNAPYQKKKGLRDLTLFFLSLSLLSFILDVGFRRIRPNIKFPQNREKEKIEEIREAGEKNTFNELLKAKKRK